MPTVSHIKVFEKKLVTDTYQVSTTCCPKFRMCDSSWKFCPYCGEIIGVEELQETTKEV